MIKRSTKQQNQFLGANRSVSPVVGTILLVATTIIVAASIGFVALDYTDDVASEPNRLSTVDLESVQIDEDYVNSFVGSLDDEQCQYYHLVIELTHTQGDPLDSDELEYAIDLVGENGTQLSGTFNTSVAKPGATATSGDSIFIAIDSDTNQEYCGNAAEESKSAVLLGGDLAWDPDTAGQVGDLFDTHNTYLDGNNADDTLEKLTLRIEHVPTGTIVIEEETTSIVDTSS